MAIENNHNGEHGLPHSSRGIVGSPFLFFCYGRSKPEPIKKSARNGVEL
jgi:hypothetical protein